MTQHQAPEVTQRARDAAADFAWDEGDVGTAALRFNIRHGRCDQHPAVQAFARFEADTRATQPLSLTVDEGLAIARLRELLAKVGWTRLVTDYLDQDYDPQREGWRIHDFPPVHGDPQRPEVANFIVDGIEDADEAAFIVAAVNFTIDSLQSLSLPVDIDRSGLAQEVDDISYAGVGP